jgi:hypothetical protein
MRAIEISIGTRLGSGSKINDSLENGFNQKMDFKLMTGGYMSQRITLWVGFFALSFILFGCVSSNTTSSTPVATSEKKGLVISPPDRQIENLEKQPAHIKFVMAAIVNTLRGGRDPIPEVRFDPTGNHVAYETDFYYEGFDLSLIQITGFTVKNETQSSADLIIEGVLNFKDLFGRGAANYFAADYTVNSNGIIINKSAITLIAPAIPDIEVYYVPKSSFDAIDVSDITSFIDLYLHAGTNAMNMVPTQDEQYAKANFDRLSDFKKMFESNPTKAGEYYIMAFCKDRLPADAALEMKITDKPEMAGKTILESGYVYDQGWRVMLSGGKFVLDALKNNLYITIRYNTNSTPESKFKIIGRYKNQKNYEDIPQFTIVEKPGMKKKSAPVVVERVMGPIESGAVFLKISDIEDAKIVQTKLRDLGYYTKKIDGLFGKGSKKALLEYKIDQGLSEETIWDLETQKTLFRGSGL